MEFSFLFIISQLISIIALVFAVIGLLSKTKNMAVKNIAVSNMFYCMSNVFLGAYIGAIGTFLATIRMATFYVLDKKGKNNILVLWVFIFLFLAVSFVKWEGFIGLLPTIGLVIYTYGAWQKDMKTFLITSMALSLCFIVYNSVFYGYINVVMEIVLFFSAFTGVLKIKKTKYQIFGNVSG